MIAKVTTHVDEAKSRLLQQSRKPNMLAAVTALSSVVQKFEDYVFPVFDARLLSNAVGAQLDGLGALVGQLRNGQDDVTYRLFILGRIFANSSDSSAPTILQMVTTIFSAKSAQIVAPSSPSFARRKRPGYIGIEVGSPSLRPDLWQQAVSLCQDCLAATVQIAWVSVYDVTNSWALDGPVAGPGLDGQAITQGMATIIYQGAGA